MIQFNLDSCCGGSLVLNSPFLNSTAVVDILMIPNLMLQGFLLSATSFSGI